MVGLLSDSYAFVNGGKYESNCKIFDFLAMCLKAADDQGLPNINVFLIPRYRETEHYENLYSPYNTRPNTVYKTNKPTNQKIKREKNYQHDRCINDPRCK